MTVIESSATALVRFTGLGILCFNDELRRGEIAALRDLNHSLLIRIQRPFYVDGGENDLVRYQDIAAYRKLPKDDVRIEIKALGNPAIEGYEIYQSGDFDRLTSEDLQDFRWVVSMNALHGNAALSPTGETLYPLTKFYIDNGLFYTYKLNTNLLFEKVGIDANGAQTQREVFGNVAETIGVKIEGEAVSFTIRTATGEETHTLPRLEGLPYRVEITNMNNNPGAVYSDMPDYYGYLSSPDGSKFDLAPIIEDDIGEIPTGGPVNQTQFCHPVASDLSSIDQL